MGGEILAAFYARFVFSDQSMGIFLSKSMIEPLSSDVRHVFTENGYNREFSITSGNSGKKIISRYIRNLGKLERNRVALSSPLQNAKGNTLSVCSSLAV